MSDQLLRLDGVSMQYGRGETAVTTLSGIDLTVSRGELVVVMGASGSGKSTLLTVAGGLTPPTSGEVIVEDHWLSQLSARQLATLRRRSLGFVFQDFNLIPSLTAIENVALPLELDGWKTRTRRGVPRSTRATLPGPTGSCSCGMGGLSIRRRLRASRACSTRCSDEQEAAHATSTGLVTVVTSMIPTVQESITVQLGKTQARLTMESPPDKSLVQSRNTSTTDGRRSDGAPASNNRMTTGPGRCPSPYAVPPSPRPSNPPNAATTSPCSCHHPPRNRLESRSRRAWYWPT
jgi:ABC-type sugar transport system ATPase subunit